MHSWAQIQESSIHHSSWAMRVFGVFDFPALLALKGRQITDGGKQRAAPGHGAHNKSPLLGEGQGWGQFAIYHL